MVHTKPAMMEEEEEEEKEKILVWWNISSCPIPSGYVARQVCSRIKSALKKAGYSGPVTITAIGDISQSLDDKVWEELSSTGITLIHAQDTELQRDFFKWIQKIPPPAKIMLISGPRQLQCLAPALFGLDWDGYEFVLAYPPQQDQVPEWVRKSFLSVVYREWLWTSFLDLGSACQIKIHTPPRRRGRDGWSCALCNFVPQSFKEFTAHLKSEQHKLMEKKYEDKLVPMKPTTEPAMMKKEKILVWWNINSCPIPSGYDACQVSSRIESALKKASYSGPLTITAIGQISQSLDDKVLEDLSSSGITLIHTEDTEIQTDLFKWIERNPPPANIMLISGCLELECIARTLYCLDWDGYDILLAYPDQEDQVSELIEKSFLSVVRRKWFLPDFLESGSPDQTRILPHTGLPQWSCSRCYDFAPPTFEQFTTHIKHMDQFEEPPTEDEDELMEPATDPNI